MPASSKRDVRNDYEQQIRSPYSLQIGRKPFARDQIVRKVGFWSVRGRGRWRERERDQESKGKEGRLAGEGKGKWKPGN